MIASADPSTSICGIAARNGDHLHLGAITVLDEEDGSLLRTTTERIWPALDDLHLCERITLLAIEVAPPTFKDDGTGRAKRQAVIGVALGRARFMFESWAYAHRVPVRFVPNLEWRTWASGWAATAAAGPVARLKLGADLSRVITSQPPQRDGSGFTVGFAGCAHTWRAANYARLTKRPERCPTCSRVGSGTKDPDPMAHKQAWVEIASRAWPVEVERVAAAARSRAKNPDRPLHQLAGVADACDAALVLQYVIDNPREPG